jgi:archaemetzincin
VASVIYLGFLSGYSPRWAGELTPRLAESLPFPVRRINLDLDLKEYYAPDRRQYHATLILARLLRHLPDGDAKIVGITSVDLFVPVLTFVFGQAQLDGSGALVSTHRLHNEFYGLPSNQELLVDRTVKEVVHELGHAWGLVHCPDYRCVMRAATYVEDVDLKEPLFCSDCRAQLKDRAGFAAVW